MPSDDVPPAPETCPGCGAVLVPAGRGTSHPGASPSCARLFDVTLRGLREDAGHAATATVLRLADAAYDAQHPGSGGEARLRSALDHLGVPATVDPAHRPTAWRTTIADVAADLDVIDLPVLVDSWARAVGEDWAAAAVRRE